jgi:tetratricopeptide (TPR) repeat protein
MNINLSQKRTPYLLIIICTVFISLLFSCQKSEEDFIDDWQKNQKQIGNLSISYPMNNTVFPPEIVAPTFVWKDEIEQVERWLVSVSLNEQDHLINIFTDQPQWRPDSIQWDRIKTLSMKQNTQIAILGVKESSIVSGSSISISTSKDSVNAPIFYRDVPLPFKHALKNLTAIKYRLGDISKEEEPRVLLEGLPVCGNCHSFTGDGKTMAMDVDYANDKGSYIISEIEDETPLTLDKIISWSDYKPEDNETTFGLLSQISPDGRYVASTVKDRSIFVAKDDLAYSQLFFPIKGIIVIYDRQTKKYFPLPGASNPKYCQSNPSWSPDGKYLIFARAKAYSSKNIEKYKTAVIPTEAANEFLKGEKEFKYDLYKIPFNYGKGGKAIPIKGASQNNKSNFFAKISPNGKWIIFTQSENFMLLQPDSKLIIIPAEGGEARELASNNSNMNSWHSWSPNGKWLVFSSKEMGPYTQLYLTHIDEKGNATPAVLLENLILENRAINIPEFVNIKSESWNKIVDVFSDSSNYPLRVGHVALYYNKFDEAIKAYSEAIKLNPEDHALWYTRAVAHKRAGKMLDAIHDLNKTLKLNPDFIEGYVELAEAYVQMKNYKGAEEYFKKALKFDQKIVSAWSGLGISNAMRKQYKASIKYFNKAIELQPDSADHWANRAISKRYIGKLNDAAVDLNKAVDLNPNFLLALKHLGEINFQLNKYTDAIKIYTNIIEIDSDNFQFYRNRGDAYLRLGNYQLAINDYDQSLFIKSDNGDVLLSRGVCKIRMETYTEAILDFDECIRLNAEDVEAYYNRADAKFWKRKLSEAIEDLDIAIQLNPKFAIAYYKRGIANIELGLMKEGCTDLKSAIELGYKDAENVSKKYCRKFK